VLKGSVLLLRGALESETPSRIQKASWMGERRSQSRGDLTIPFHKTQAATAATKPVTIHAV
jgi:hypothetical protein